MGRRQFLILAALMAVLIAPASLQADGPSGRLLDCLMQGWTSKKPLKVATLEEYPNSAEDSVFIRKSLGSTHQNPNDVQADGRHAFRIAGTNTTQSIEAMSSINGIPLKKLANRMLRWQMDRLAKQSEYPMLEKSGYYDSAAVLRDTLATDNTTVLEHHLTHQQVAEPLIQAIEASTNLAEGRDSGALYIFADQPNAKIIEINGKQFQIEARTMVSSSLMHSDTKGRVGRTPGIYRGYRDQGQGDALASPFDDGLAANVVLTITRVKGKNSSVPDGQPDKLEVDGLTPFLIYKYGFYQGGPHRVDPETIIRFFGL